MEFFHHRLLQHGLLSSLLEVLSATNVVVRWWRRKRRRCSEWLLVEGVFQNRFHALVAARSGQQCAIGGRFHPGRGVLLGESDNAPTRLITPSRLGVFG